MRKALLLLLFAATASAETFGPVTVESRPGVAGLREGTYYEHRFAVLNPTAEPHRVRIDVSGMVASGMGQPRVSRTVIVAPRSSMLVSLPQYVFVESGVSLAKIEVDGSGEETLPLGYLTGTTYRSARDILVGRTVPGTMKTALVPNDEMGNTLYPQVGPASWSTNWLHYSSLSGIVLTPQDWNELPRAAQTAILRWVSGGGSLTFIGQVENLPPLRPAVLENVAAGHLGFGWICFLPETVDPTPVAAAVQGTWRQPDVDSRALWYGGMNDETPIPLLDDAAMPLKSLFSVLVVFAIAGGPLNLWLLARKKRRLWIFWTLPVLAVLTAAILVGALIASEGWVRIQKTVSLTLLDERLGEAVTLGWTGLYATLSPEPAVRFESGTEVRPLFSIAESHTDWTDGQRFVSGWIGSRLPRGFAVRKVEPRRERIPMRRENGHLIAVNGLGAELKELWVADETGLIHHAANVPAGKEVVLTSNGEHVDADVKDPATLFSRPLGWASYHARFSAQPRSALRPGTYVAVLHRSPFVETALARPTKSTSEATVIGLMRGIDDAR